MTMNCSPVVSSTPWMVAIFAWLRVASSFASRSKRGAFRVRAEFCRQDLDRDLALEPGISRSIHLAHAPGAEGGEDVIRA
jgi:hypothetical protein